MPMSNYTNKRLLVLHRNANTDYLSTGFRGGGKYLGPEKALVNSFIRDNPLDVAEGMTGAIFIEPKIESGYPDLVIVLIEEKEIENWRPPEIALSEADFRLIQYLYQVGPGSESEISKGFGLKSRKSLDRLASVGWLKLAKNEFSPTQLSRFSATEIIAVEAKISDPRRALLQAATNTWFASRSIVLTGSKTRAMRIKPHARSSRLGLWVFDDSQLVQLLKGTKFSQPRSYVSRLFDYWARVAITNQR